MSRRQRGKYPSEVLISPTCPLQVALFVRQRVENPKVISVSQIQRKAAKSKQPENVWNSKPTKTGFFLAKKKKSAALQPKSEVKPAYSSPLESDLHDEFRRSGKVQRPLSSETL